MVGVCCSFVQVPSSVKPALNCGEVWCGVCVMLLQDLEYDRRLQEVPRLLPSSLSLPAITASEFCVNYVQQLKGVLHKHPPNQPTDMAIDMLAAVAQLQR